MPISSLPSPYGIGTLGAEARKFADFLAAGGQSCWQLLPVGPTSYGDSPYQSFSSFAGNPYFIDLDGKTFYFNCISHTGLRLNFVGNAAVRRIGSTGNQFIL